MKIGRFTLSAASLALLIVQLALVSTVTAKHLYQRWRCPRVWTMPIKLGRRHDGQVFIALLQARAKKVGRSWVLDDRLHGLIQIKIR